MKLQTLIERFNSEAYYCRTDAIKANRPEYREAYDKRATAIEAVMQDLKDGRDLKEVYNEMLERFVEFNDYLNVHQIEGTCNNGDIAYYHTLKWIIDSIEEVR